MNPMENLFKSMEWQNKMNSIGLGSESLGNLMKSTQRQNEVSAIGLGYSEGLGSLIKSMQRQNDPMQIESRLGSLQSIAEMISKQNHQFDFNGLSGLRDIARTISRQIKPFDAASMVFGNNMQAQIDAMNPKKNPLFGLTSTLTEIAKTNQLVSDRLSGFASSQLFLSSSFQQIAKALNESHLKQFNSLDIVVKNISTSYIKHIGLTHNWEDIEVAENANEVITNVTDKLLNENTQITTDDLYDLSVSIVTGLHNLLGKTRKEKGRQFIFELITIVSFLLTFYGTYQSHGDLSNRQVLSETRIEIEKVNKQLSEKIDVEFNKLNKTRIARINVNLLYSDKKNSKIIGIVKIGQEVTVIEIRHEYLLVAYMDKESKEPKSGFVIKKYFEVTN